MQRLADSHVSDREHESFGVFGLGHNMNHKPLKRKGKFSPRRLSVEAAARSAGSAAGLGRRPRREVQSADGAAELRPPPKHTRGDVRDAGV